MIFNFRTRLLLAMMLLVVGVTVATLLIAENQMRQAYEGYLRDSFTFQIDSFLRQREARLAPVRSRVASAATNPRMLAAMEIAGQAEANPQDVDDLYQNGVDQLEEALKAYGEGKSEAAPGFFLFLNSKGQVLFPSANAKLPFVMPGLRRITPQIEMIGQAVSQSGMQQVGYLAPREEGAGTKIREMLFTPIADQVNHRRLGVMAVGFPLPESSSEVPPRAVRNPKNDLLPLQSVPLSNDRSILSGIWLDDQLYSATVSTNEAASLENAIAHQIQAGKHTWTEVVPLQGAPHQLYCQALHLGTAFPPAYQVCLYSLAEVEKQKQGFQRRIFLFGAIALAGALGFGWLFSRSLAVPVQELVAGTTEIERGNYAARVRVHGGSELARLGEAFNNMASRVQSSNLAQEERFAERTRELAERKRAEEALRRSETSLREAQRIAQLGNWHWNVATNELLWSDEIYRIFGLANREFKANYESFLERVHPGDREMVRQAVSQSLERGTPYGIDHRVVRPDGSIRIVHEQAEVLRDSSGTAVGMVGTVQDITEQKRLESEFLRAQRMDSIGALASGLAHDLNNALSPILMGIQLIRPKTEDEDTLQTLAVMEANTYRGADMVRQVLTFTRGQDGERELLDLGRLIREMEQVARQTLPKAITITTLVPPDLWQVLGNSTQLHQVLLNLCTNARDAMPKGGELTMAADNVELSADEARAISDGSPGPYAVLLVSDTGMGIPPEVMPHIFKPFFTTKGAGKGTGLGLSTIARIVRNHGGFLSVKSEPEAGTTFEIYLPRGHAAPSPAAPAQESTLPRGHDELILLIEDDRSVREMVSTSLAEYGYQVVTATGHADALAQLERHGSNLRLALTNPSVPSLEEASAFDAVCSVRPDLPTILVTGAVQVDKPGPGNVVACLSKPFSLAQLLNAVAKGLNHPAKRT